MFINLFFIISTEVKMKVEVFVKCEEVLLQSTQLGRPTAGHYCTAHDTFKTEEVFTEDSRRILEEATKKAKELDAKVLVYNLSTLKGKLIAKLKGVKSPTWIIVE